MPPKKSNLNNASSKGARRKRVERAQQSPEQIETRNAAQRIRTAESRAQKYQEQRDERLQQNIIQLDDVVHMNSELVEQPIEFISLDSLQNSDEHLPQCPPNTSRTKDMPIPKKKSFRKIYCRLCLEQTTNNHMNHLMIMDHNYVGKSEVNKFNKIMQTQRINSMIRVVMPTFDYDLAYNPIICHRCVARLELAYKFITACEDNEKVIRQYKEQFSPNELVSCDDVAENKTLFVKPAVRTYGNDSVDSRKDTKAPVPSNVDQTEQVSDVGSGGRESQENPTPDTNFEATEFVKCETQEEYNDEGASSRFVITSEELSCIVKEEIVVKEDVPSEFCDTSADERLGHPETDRTIKDEDGLPLACGTSEYDSHHTDSSGSHPNYKGMRTYHSVGKKRKEMEDTT